MATIITPRPPLNLFEVVRTQIGSDWQTIYDVPSYTIPANGPNPSRVVGTAAIMTGLAVCPMTPAGATISARVLAANGADNFLLIDGAIAPAGDFLSISLDRQVLRNGERLQVKCGEEQSAMTHFSFILNQREEFTEISA